MKKNLVKILIFLVILLSFINFVYAVSLNENTTWQSDLTGVYHSSLALGDIDNDNDLDLALIGAGESSYIAKIYINNGTSLAENSTWQQNLTGVIRGSIAFGDIDNDGDLDLAFTGCSSGGEYASDCDVYVVCYPVIISLR